MVDDLYRIQKRNIDAVGIAYEPKNGYVVAGICMDLQTHIFQPVCQKCDLIGGGAVL
jgi:hypothetical protein